MPKRAQHDTKGKYEPKTFGDLIEYLEKMPKDADIVLHDKKTKKKTYLDRTRLINKLKTYGVREKSLFYVMRTYEGRGILPTINLYEKNIRVKKELEYDEFGNWYPRTNKELIAAIRKYKGKIYGGLVYEHGHLFVEVTKVSLIWSLKEGHGAEEKPRFFLNKSSHNELFIEPFSESEYSDKFERNR